MRNPRPSAPLADCAHRVRAAPGGEWAALRIEAMDESFGACVTGLDPARPPDADEALALRASLAASALLVVRGGARSPLALAGLAAVFGVRAEPRGGRPGGPTGRLGWHGETAGAAVRVLHVGALPDARRAGLCQYAHLGRAWSGLRPDVQQRCRGFGLRSGARCLALVEESADGPVLALGPALDPQQPAQLVALEGMPPLAPAIACEWLDYLVEHATRLDYRARPHWQPFDTAVIDTRRLLVRRLDTSAAVLATRSEWAVYR